MSAESILVASYAGPSNIIKGNSAWNKVMGPHKKSSKTCTKQIPEYKEYWRCRSNSDKCLSFLFLWKYLTSIKISLIC